MKKSSNEIAKNTFVAKHHLIPGAQREKHLDPYIHAVDRDVFQADQSRLPRQHNITKNELGALHALSNRQGIVINPADEGGGS